MKKLLLTLALIVLPLSVLAQNRTANIFTNYDLDAVAYIFCDATDLPEFMPTCATGVAAEDGWMLVPSHVNKTIGFILNTITATGGVDVQIQVRMQQDDGAMSEPIILMNLINKTVVDTDNQFVRLPDEVAQFRVGIQFGTADQVGVDDVEVIYNAR